MNMLWDFLFPPHCPSCNSYVGEQGQWCQECLDKTLVCHQLPIVSDLQKIFPQGIWCLGMYQGSLRDLVRSLKYQKQKKNLAGLHSFIGAGLEQIHIAGDVVVPVPLHGHKLAQRGFNQSQLLFEKPFAQRGLATEELLSRQVDTKPQFGLSARERQANMQQVFVATRPERIVGRDVILVDDIMTTGATLAACGEILLQAGARSVVGLVLASGRK